MDYVLKNAETGMYVANGKWKRNIMTAYAGKRGAFRALARYQKLRGSEFDPVDVVLQDADGVETVLYE